MLDVEHDPAGHYVLMDEGQVVAHTHYEGTEALRLARLMAAAPAMLAALVDLLSSDGDDLEAVDNAARVIEKATRA